MPFAVYRSGRTSSIKVEHVQLKEEIVWVRLYDIKSDMAYKIIGAILD